MGGNFTAIVEIKARMCADVASGGIRRHWDEVNGMQSKVWPSEWCTRRGWWKSSNNFRTVFFVLYTTGRMAPSFKATLLCPSWWLRHVT